MKRVPALFFVAVLGALAADDPVVFKSDVSMTRVDAQVVDAVGRPITGLTAKDFVLRVDGKPQPIRNFASESMPVDVLLLLDVSGSMQPHIQRIADASESALRVLAPGDRIAIMVFDTHTRTRLPFRSDHGEVSQELHSLLRSERFNGGTHITRALLDAAHYIQREGRPNARRAIVILTDDETQDAEDEPSVEQALDEANAVLSFLRAPYEEPSMPGGGVPRSNGPWGGGGGSGPIGGNGPWGGGGGGSWPGGGTWPGGRARLPGGATVGGMDPSHTAGTADIAKDSGGDVMQVDSASAFQDTLERLRQRYALYFYWPPGPANPEERLVTLALSHSAGAANAQSEVRYRRAYLGKGTGRASGSLMEVSREPDSTDPAAKQGSPTDASATASSYDDRPRRVAVNEDSDLGPNPAQDDPTPETQPADAPPVPIKPEAAKAASSPAPPIQQHRGWPSADGSAQQH